MGVGEKLAEGGFAVHNAFPGDEFVSALVVGGFSEEVAGIRASVPFRIGFGFVVALDFDIDCVARNFCDCAGEGALLDVFGPPCGGGFLHVVVENPDFGDAAVEID